MNTSRPTILQIIPKLDTGGAELATVEITAALVAAGARALVATEGGRMAKHITEAGGEIVTMPVATKNPLRIYRNAGRLIDLIDREGVDLLHARSRAPAWSAWIAARRTSHPFVTTYHGAYSENGPLKRAYNSVMARADIVIANSHYTADLIRNRYATPDERIQIIYRGLDETAFSPTTLSADRVAALRSKWNLAPDTRILLHAARLTGWKGQHIVINAAALLNDADALDRVAIILAGDAQGRETYEAQLRTKIASLGLTEKVRLVGHVNDIAAAFRASHVAIVASTEPEAFGRTGTEAQAMQCPVIATRIGAPQETVRSAPEYALSERTGWLIPPNDPDALAAAMREALAINPGDRDSIGTRARAFVTSKFTLDRMKSDTLSVYDRLLGTALSQQQKTG